MGGVITRSVQGAACFRNPGGPVVQALLVLQGQLASAQSYMSEGTGRGEDRGVEDRAIQDGLAIVAGTLQEGQR